jgi:hypothetical protein
MVNETNKTYSKYVEEDKCAQEFSKKATWET